jgi:polysaccharide biosynthesis transport protein
VDVKFRLPDPALAARVVNALARNYIEQNLEYKFVASKEASDWLGERLSEQRRQVEQAEIALQRYRSRHDAIPLQHRENIVVQKLADLNAAVTQAKTERFQKQALYNQLESLRTEQQRGARQLPGHPGQRLHPAAEGGAGGQLQSQYGAALGQARRAAPRDGQGAVGDRARRRPSWRARSQGRAVGAQRVPGGAGAGEQPDGGALNQQKAEAQAMNRKAIDYGVLERDVESERQIYESLLQRAKETGRQQRAEDEQHPGRRRRRAPARSPGVAAARR